MTSRKALITKMAQGAGAVLALAALVGGLAAWRALVRQERWDEGQRREREAQVGRTREYLAELAKKVEAVPVDPNLVGEIEARYFEEQASGPMYVWAMGPGGDFLFGVPREAFSRLNKIYDRDVLPRMKDGVVLERQTFLRNLVDRSADVRPKEFSEADLGDSEDPGRELLRFRQDGNGAFTLSAPLKSAGGAPLGSLYLKRRAPAEHQYYRDDPRFEVVGGICAGAAALSFAFLWVLLPTWVYVDARERSMPRAPLFAFLTAISSVFGLVVYLIARPESARALTCPGCSREVDGGAYCPHCGRDLSSAVCVACRYPLAPDWVYCPACRAEVKRPAASPASASEAAAASESAS